jgi:ribosomal protein S18 acetylase RimI-like enzyme
MTEHSMSLDVRAFELIDIPSAIGLWSAADGIELDASDSPEALASFLRRNPGSSTVAFLDGSFAGAALCGHDGRRGLLHHLAVADFARRRGVGRAILERCLSRLREAGILKCHALVFRDNRFGELFWTPAGWDRRDLVCLYSRFV